MAKQDNNRGLTDRQIKAIPFLVSAPTSEKGCKAAHVSRNTYYEWLKNPVFKEELNRCRDAIISESFGILKQNVTAAVDTLVNLLSSTEREDLKRLLANDIIGYVLKVRELEELEQRIAALESQIKEKN